MEQTPVSSTATHALLSTVQDDFLSWEDFSSLMHLWRWGSGAVCFGIFISSLEELQKKVEKSSGASCETHPPSLVELSTRHSLQPPKSQGVSAETEKAANAEVQAHPINYHPTKLAGKADEAAISKPD